MKKKSEVRKSGSPKDIKKAEGGVPNAEVTKKLEVRSPRSEEENNSAFDTPHSEIKELPTANSKPQTETMEVHHHPEVEKKGPKEYLLEGLMIFLAVTMGFFAENLRERVTDQNREKEYMRSMV